MTPAVLKKVDTIAKKAYALKLNGIHFLNAPAQMNMVMSVLKPILKPKIFNRVSTFKISNTTIKIRALDSQNVCKQHVAMVTFEYSLRCYDTTIICVVM